MTERNVYGTPYEATLQARQDADLTGNGWVLLIKKTTGYGYKAVDPRLVYLHMEDSDTFTPAEWWRWSNTLAQILPEEAEGWPGVNADAPQEVIIEQAIRHLVEVKATLDRIRADVEALPRHMVAAWLVEPKAGEDRLKSVYAVRADDIDAAMAQEGTDG